MLQDANFPYRLQERMQSMKLTPEKLQKLSGITSRTIYTYQSPADFKNIKSENIIKLLAALNCDFEFLFGDGDSPVSKTHEYISSQTGLSTSSIDRLIEINDAGLAEVLSALLENEKIIEVLQTIQKAKAVRVPDVKRFESQIKKEIADGENQGFPPVSLKCFTDNPNYNEVWDNQAVVVSKLSPKYTAVTRDVLSTLHLRDAQDSFFEIAKHYTEGKK